MAELNSIGDADSSIADVDKQHSRCFNAYMDALLKAVNLAGSQRELALIIGGRQSRISEMFRRGAVPPEAVLPIAEAVQFQVTPHELRPDLYPYPTDAVPANRRATTK